MIHIRPAVLITAAVVLLAGCAGSRKAAPLFNGTNLDGWRVSEHPTSASVVDGAIQCQGERAHVFYVGKDGRASWKNFDMSVEFLTRPGANSGVFFHTAYQDTDWPRQGFEVQVNNSQQAHNGYYEFKKTGSLYGIRNTYRQLAPDDQWNTLRIRVVGNHVQTWVNGIEVVDYVEPADARKKIGSGTIAFQCHDPESTAQYRNVRVTALPDDLTDGLTAPVRDDVYNQVLRLSNDNYPLIDLHTHLKSGLTADRALEMSQRDGISYGVAPNVGLGFWIQNDAGIAAFIDSMKAYPQFYLGMQAEGREWVNLVSREAVGKFDYVFADAMTFTDDRNGKRSRLWMPAEVTVGDKQEFMDLLVSKILGVVNNEPIDIYANPTFLPDAIQPEYDVLWTDARMDTVIAALKDNTVALEINSRYRIPSMAFLKKAKQAGLKFTCGTNNVVAEVGRSEYCLEAVQTLELKNTDFFVPGAIPMRVKRVGICL